MCTYSMTIIGTIGCTVYYYCQTLNCLVVSVVITSQGHVVCVSWWAQLAALITAKQARGEHEYAHVHGCTCVRPLGRSI